MKRFIFSLAVIMSCIMTSCNDTPHGSPHAAPISGFRDDEYIYPWGKFYAPSGNDEVDLGFVHLSPNSPVIWVKGKPVDIKVDSTPEAVIARIGEPDSVSYDGALEYRRQTIGGSSPVVRFIVKDNILITVVIREQGGLSLAQDSEILTIPFSRQDLIRVFGNPKELIESP